MSEFASGEIQLEQAVLQLLVDVITSQRSVCTYTAMQLKVNTSGLRAYCTGVGTSCSIKDIFSFFTLLQIVAAAADRSCLEVAQNEELALTSWFFHR